MRVANPRDFLAGLLFGSFGLFVSVYAATHYAYGSAVRMGAGYFPTWIGGIVALLGFGLAIASLRSAGPPLPAVALRPAIFILGASIAYGYMLKPLGLVLSTFLVVMISAFGGHEFRWRETALLAAALAVFAVGVFVYALGLPFPLWPERFQ